MTLGMKEEMEAILRLLTHSWRDIEFRYEGLTDSEKAAIPREVFEQLVKKLHHPNGQIELLQEQFIAWREEVDVEHVLDSFDLALGFFSGAGLDHNTAVELAAEAAR